MEPTVKPEARWRYLASSARWHLAACWRFVEPVVIVASFSVCGLTPGRRGRRWRMPAPGGRPFVRCLTCRRLAPKYRVTDRDEGDRTDRKRQS